MARKLRFTCHTGVVAANVQPVTNMFGQTLWLTLLVSMCGSSDGSSRPEMEELTTHFGVTWSWHEQFSKGICTMMLPCKVKVLCVILRA